MISKLDEFQILMGWDNQYMPKEYSDSDIFHYTSPSGFESILTKDKRNAILWASRYDCLNDISEGTIAQKMFKQVCDEMLDSEEITSEMHSLIYNVSAAKTVLIPINQKDKTVITRPVCDVYISSFSLDPDSLAMWSYYSKGNKCEGYNIGFCPSEIIDSLESMFFNKEIKAEIFPVVYTEKEQKNYIRSLVLKLQEHYAEEYKDQIRCIISEQLCKWKLIFKSEYFQHEKEVRIIVYVGKRTKDGVPEPSPIEIKYRSNYGFLVPYIELKIEKTGITFATMGPLHCDEAQKASQKSVLQDMLAVNDCCCALAQISNIPLRF